MQLCKAFFKLCKAFFKFLWLALRPLSKLESALGWWDVFNLMIVAMYSFLHYQINWLVLFEYAQLTWLLGFPILLLLIAGVKLQLKVMPGLEIIFDPQAYPRCRETIFAKTIYRVGVKLNGSDSKDDVHIVLSEMHLISKRSSSSVLPQELNPSTHQPGTEHGRFTVHPNEPPTFVNVAEWTPGEEIAVCYQENYKFKEPAQEMESRREIPNKWPIGEYRLVLVASGRNVASVREIFYLAVVNSEFLFCKFSQRPVSNK